ncbi:hypothetical protein [Actinoplanes sp. NPDC051494]|uniref:hypothetical protein n=1 Tax=Actinoplanes sp. NPDC051494 TaxID=3363907 RepID=UPI0037B2B632
MTERITLSLPDDVAATLRAAGNMSAYVTEAVRRRTVRDRHNEAMRAVGLDPEALGTEEAKRRTRSRLYVSPERQVAGREFARRLAAGEVTL